MRKASWRFKLSAVAGELYSLARRESKEAASVANAMADELRKIVWTEPRIPKKHLKDILAVIESGVKSKMVRHPKKWKKIAREIRRIL